jgi:hypothetical protein
MKQLLMVTFATLIAFGGLTWAHEASNLGSAQHGGAVAAAAHMDFELVTEPELIRLYVRDHGKTPDLSKARARLTLLTGGGTQQIELEPAGDRLEARGNFPPAAGAKAVAVVELGSRRPITVRFLLAESLHKE